MSVAISNTLIYRSYQRFLGVDRNPLIMGLSILPAIVVGCSYNSFQTFGSITYHISHYFVSRILLLSLVGSSSGTSFLGGPASFWYCSGWILDGFPVFVEKISFTWMKRTKDKSLRRVFERPKKICCWKELRIWLVQIYNWNSNYEPAASSKSSTRYPHHQTFRFLELNQRWWLRDRFPVWLRGIFYIYIMKPE